MLDNLSSGLEGNLDQARLSGRLEFAAGSVLDAGLFGRMMDGCSAVYHLAASVGVELVTSRTAECLRNNVEGVQNLVDLARSGRRPPRVILFSSSEVYGKSEDIPLVEDGDLLLGASTVPRWSYAAGKAVGEFLALGEHRRSGLPVTIVRCFNTCGPRQRAAYGMVLPTFVTQALAGEPLTVFGDGGQSRCFSYVRDVVRGVLQLADEPSTSGEIYNIGCDEETSILGLARRIVRLTGTGSPIRFQPYSGIFGPHFEDVRRRVPDLGKIRRAIGYTPEAGLDELLRLTLEHARAACADATPAAVAENGAGVRPVSL